MPNDKEQKNPSEDSAEEQNYSFLQETIKVKPTSRESLIKQFVRIAIYGLILGVFACLGFFALKPWIQEWFGGSTKTVNIQGDEQSGEDPSQIADGNSPESVFNAESYEEMTAGMNALAKEAQRSIVSVSTVSEDEAWKGDMTGEHRSVSGMITGDNGRELLVLTDSSICEDASAWEVTFSNGKKFRAVLKKQDANRKIAVFGIGQSSLDTDTKKAVKVAVLGNSNVVMQGEGVLALGNMFGYTDGMSYGVVSASNHKASFFDGECEVIATDIPAEEKGTGVLFNMDGEAVGLISASARNGSGKNVVNAYGISDLKPIIELLVNGKSVPYVGIRGTTVTPQLSEEHGMPQGIYVADVDPDSPAMAAGIQTGDIICQAAGEKVTDLSAYQTIVIDSSVGETMELVGKRLGADGYVDVDFSVVTEEKSSE
ncbi:S1C family serine protease [Mediterraneibacter sp.]|jgi:serine protease Do|uniref:S1C family serine protease n=1 Tax=Mediterraneibacter sp. TaxID=2316022 RepID=UPI0015AD2343|nr:S1C family serine protease [Mediterraneibacter sp.]